MTRIGVRFVPSYKREGRSKDFADFGEFMVSEQIRKPLGRAAIDVVAVAKALAGRSGDARKPASGPHYADAFSIHLGPMETIVVDARVGMPNRRAMVQISNDSPQGVAVEFGSGEKAEGTSGTDERPQGGWNKAMRPLGRAGRTIGRAVEGA